MMSTAQGMVLSSSFASKHKTKDPDIIGKQTPKPKDVNESNYYSVPVIPEIKAIALLKRVPRYLFCTNLKQR